MKGSPGIAVTKADVHRAALRQRRDALRLDTRAVTQPRVRRRRRGAAPSAPSPSPVMGTTCTQSYEGLLCRSMVRLRRSTLLALKSKSRSPSEPQLHAGVRFAEPFATMMPAVVEAQNRKLASLGMPPTATISALVKVWVQERLVSEAQRFVAEGDLDVPENIRKLLTTTSLETVLPSAKAIRSMQSERTQGVADMRERLAVLHSDWQQRQRKIQKGKAECKALLAQIDVMTALEVVSGSKLLLLECRRQVNEFRPDPSWSLDGVHAQFDRVDRSLVALIDDMTAEDIRAGVR